MIRLGLLVLTFLVVTSGCQTATRNRSTQELPPEQGPWNLSGKPPHLLAHYMPWFSTAPSWQHWRWPGPGPSHDPERLLADGRRDIAAVSYPLIGPYDSSSQAVVRYHLETAKAAGIQAFGVIWYGPGSDTDKRMPLLLSEAQATGMRIATCYEEKINFPGYRQPQSRQQVVDQVVADLTYILQHYGNHPAYLKREGKPFVYQFNSWGTRRLGPSYLLPAEWREVFSRLPGPLVYGRQNLDEPYHPPIESAYLWWTPNSLDAESFAQRAVSMRQQGRLSFFMSMACPGFDDTGVWGWGNGPRKSPTTGLPCLRGTLDHALAGDPELVQIITWNDFNEGTVVEPTRENGFEYLDAIETWWSQRTGRPADLKDNREPFAQYSGKHKVPSADQ